MATPTVPASQSAAVKSAEIRADTSQEVSMLNAFVRVLEGKRERAKDELVQVIRSLTTLETEMGKLGQDTFVKLADLQRDYYKTVSAGQVQPVDMVKYAVKLLELDQDTNVALGVKDRVLFDRAVSNANLAGPKGTPEHNKVLVGTVTTDLNAGLTSPALPGTMDLVTGYLELPAGTDLSTLGGQNAAEVNQKYRDRKEAAAGISAKSAEMRRALGDYGNIQKLGLLSQGGNQVAIDQAAAAIGPTLTEALKYAEKFPGKDDISERLVGERARVTKLRQDLDQDPMMALETFRSSMTKASQPKRDVDFYKTIGSTKFQRWAASNNLQVGKMRPATTDADKEKVGYISELNAVYEPGPDDQRSLVVAHNQSTMKPGSQLFTRRGLEARRNVEVQVGTKGAEREVTVDKAGQEVTPEQIAAQTKFTRVASVDGDTVYIRADGSGISKTKQYTQDDLAYASEKPLTDAQAKQVGDSVRASMFSTKKVAGDPSGVQTLRGRETAMLPTDPADTLYVIETTDGRRVPIRESQMLSETVIGKGEPDAKTKLIEEPRMALRKPLAMLRARGARLKEEKAADETAAPEEVVQLPTRTGVSAGSSPAPAGMETPATLKRKEATVALREPLARMSIAQAKKDSAIAGLQADFLKEGDAEATSETGRAVRKAAGNEQTGAAAGTVAASIPPIALGTPKNAPTYEVTQGKTKYTVDATPLFTPEELAKMDAPETAAQRKARVMREMRSTLGETPATAPIP